MGDSVDDDGVPSKSIHDWRQGRIDVMPVSNPYMLLMGGAEGTHAVVLGYLAVAHFPLHKDS